MAAAWERLPITGLRRPWQALPTPLPQGAGCTAVAAAALGRRSGTKMAQVAPSLSPLLSLSPCSPRRHPRERGLVAWKGAREPGSGGGKRPFERRSAVRTSPPLPSRVRTFYAIRAKVELLCPGKTRRAIGQ